MRSSRRGSALLAALVVIGVLALVTAATMRLATLSKTNSVRDSRKLFYALIPGRDRIIGVQPEHRNAISNEATQRHARHANRGPARPAGDR